LDLKQVFTWAWGAETACSGKNLNHIRRSKKKDSCVFSIVWQIIVPEKQKNQAVLGFKEGRKRVSEEAGVGWKESRMRGNELADVWGRTTGGRSRRLYTGHSKIKVRGGKKTAADTVRNKWWRVQRKRSWGPEKGGVERKTPARGNESFGR